MPDRDEAPKQGISTDPTMRTFVVFLVFFAVVLVLLALGLTWKGLLHWTGELLLLIGILLAAKGISDVRRECTGRPGIWRSVKHKAQSIRVRAAAFLWARWNQVVQWDWPANRLHLRPHSKSVQETSGIASDGRETAGREVSAWWIETSADYGCSLVTRDYTTLIPSDARNNHQEGKINDGSALR